MPRGRRALPWAVDAKYKLVLIAGRRVVPIREGTDLVHDADHKALLLNLVRLDGFLILQDLAYRRSWSVCDLEKKRRLGTRRW